VSEHLTDPPPSTPLSLTKGRGAATNVDSRFHAWAREAEVVEAWPEEELPPVQTIVSLQRGRSIISRNESPDIPFDRSINPYQGCEHGCVYCYARPSHAYWGLSPGLDFETRILAKENAAELLVKELAKPGYAPRWVALGANTDPYQPAEKRLRITRSVLEVLSQCRHPVGITTKSALVTRDIDLLAPMAAQGLAHVMISIGSLDPELARTLEPRANSPQRRIEAIRRLSQAGIPVGVIVAPVIPALNDHEIESVLEAAAGAGAVTAGHVLLRLPLEVAKLFTEWLELHHPQRAAHVMSVLRQMRAGQVNDPRFGARMRGEGPFARILSQRFALAARRLGLLRERAPLNTALFRPPPRDPVQSDLFGA